MTLELRRHKKKHQKILERNLLFKGMQKEERLVEETKRKRMKEQESKREKNLKKQMEAQKRIQK